MHQSWVNRWQLDRPIRPEWTIPSDDTAAAAVTARIDKVVRRAGFGFKTYALRHAFAARCFRQGVPVGTAAKVMGHSPEVHSRTYQQWISEAQVLESFEQYT
jgi:integrase